LLIVWELFYYFELRFMIFQTQYFKIIILIIIEQIIIQIARRLLWNLLFAYVIISNVDILYSSMFFMLILSSFLDNHLVLYLLLYGLQHFVYDHLWFFFTLTLIQFILFVVFYDLAASFSFLRFKAFETWELNYWCQLGIPGRTIWSYFWVIIRSLFISWRIDSI